MQQVGRIIQETEFTQLKQTTTIKAEVESAQQKASKVEVPICEGKITSEMR